MIPAPIKTLFSGYWTYLAVIVILVALAWKIDSFGYNRAEQACKLKVAEIERSIQDAVIKERERMDAVNAEVRRIADMKIEQLNSTIKDLENTLKDNHNEAINDPDANSGGISSRSVFRLNKIHGE